MQPPPHHSNAKGQAQGASAAEGSSGAERASGAGGRSGRRGASKAEEASEAGTKSADSMPPLGAPAHGGRTGSTAGDSQVGPGWQLGPAQAGQAW